MKGFTKIPNSKTFCAFYKETKEQFDQKTRKLMTTYSLKLGQTLQKEKGIGDISIKSYNEVMSERFHFEK